MLCTDKHTVHVWNGMLGVLSGKGRRHRWDKGEQNRTGQDRQARPTQAEAPGKGGC